MGGESDKVNLFLRRNLELGSGAAGQVETVPSQSKLKPLLKEPTTRLWVQLFKGKRRKSDISYEVPSCSMLSLGFHVYWASRECPKLDIRVHSSSE